MWADVLPLGAGVLALGFALRQRSRLARVAGRLVRRG